MSVKKLQAVSKLVNQFASSIRHKPFHNEIDKARTLGFVAALRDVLAGVEKPKLTEVKNVALPLDEQRAVNKEGLKALRKQMEGNQDD